MPRYTFYVDLWLLRLGCNFLFEYLLLWAAASITHTKTRPRALLLAAAAGTFHYLLYLLAGLGLLPFYGLLRFFPVIVLVSLAMIFIAFGALSWTRFLSVTAHFYGIGFVAAGTGLAGAYLFGSGAGPLYPAGMIVSILTVLIISEVGWGIVHRRMLRQVYQVPLWISCSDWTVKIKALVDTGNNLVDPLNNQPVIIVEQACLDALLPKELAPIAAALERGEISALDRLEELDAWQTRIRLIPFNSIGKKNGLLIGFRPDDVQIGKTPGQARFHPTIAIHPRPLDPHGDYKALIPPALVELKDQELLKGGKSHANAESSDF